MVSKKLEFDSLWEHQKLCGVSQVWSKVRHCKCLNHWFESSTLLQNFSVCGEVWSNAGDCKPPIRRFESGHAFQIIMVKLENQTPEQYLECLEASGLVTDKNRPAILAVAEMMKHPLTLEQKRAQVAKGCPHLVRYTGPVEIKICR